MEHETLETRLRAGALDAQLTRLYGAEGLEAYYDSYLQGTSGEIITTKGNLGTEMLYNYEKYYDAKYGLKKYEKANKRKTIRGYMTHDHVRCRHSH